VFYTLQLQRRRFFWLRRLTIFGVGMTILSITLEAGRFHGRAASLSIGREMQSGGTAFDPVTIFTPG
jgi:hypothetical protein